MNQIAPPQFSGTLYSLVNFTNKPDWTNPSATAQAWIGSALNSLTDEKVDYDSVSFINSNSKAGFYKIETPHEEGSKEDQKILDDLRKTRKEEDGFKFYDLKTKLTTISKSEEIKKLEMFGWS